MFYWTHFPVWLKFKGGKGVATYLGVILALSYQFFLVFGLSWITLSLLFRFASLSSMTSSLIVFLYGSMIWGVLPTHLPVSWEGHLSGFIAGILLAFIYKNEGPKKKKYNWEIEEEIEARNTEKITINYINKK